jgi:Flagellar hook-length control protein FliK
MAITITPIIPPASAPSAPAVAAGIVLQAGQVITAQVVQILGNDQVQIAIGNQTIDAATQVPLQVGQTLQLQVSQTTTGVGLTIVNSPSSASSSEAGSSAASTSNAIVLSPTLAASLAANGTTDAIIPASLLTPVETLAVSVAAESAATQQTSLAPLFADLTAAAGLPNLPPQVQDSITQVLALRTNLDPSLTATAVKQAFQSSGLFLEASLASGSAPSPSGTPDLKAALIVLRQVLASSLASTGADTTPPTAAAPQAAVPAAAAVQASEPAAATAPASGALPTAAASAQEIQAAVQTLAPVTILAEVAGGTPIVELIAGSPGIAPQFAAAGAAASTQGAAVTSASEIFPATQASTPAATPDAAVRAAATSAALNLLQEVFQGTPGAVGAASNLVLENGQLLSLLPVVSGVRTLAIDDPEFARTNLPPPPVNGALPSAQPIAPVTLPAHAPLEATLQHLLAGTDGAIARQTLLQIASLPGQSDPSAPRIDLAGPRWNFEIPFATPQGTAMAQFEISRDGGGREVEAAKATWRARFSLNVEPAGPVHALISLVGARTSVRMWAERPATASQLRAGLSQLSQALSRADLEPGDIVVRDGAPVQPTPATAGHFLDRAL